MRAQPELMRDMVSLHNQSQLLVVSNIDCPMDDFVTAFTRFFATAFSVYPGTELTGLGTEQAKRDHIRQRHRRVPSYSDCRDIWPEEAWRVMKGLTMLNSQDLDHVKQYKAWHEFAQVLFHTRARYSVWYHSRC